VAEVAAEAPRAAVEAEASAAVEAEASGRASGLSWGPACARSTVRPARTSPRIQPTWHNPATRRTNAALTTTRRERAAHSSSQAERPPLELLPLDPNIDQRGSVAARPPRPGGSQPRHPDRV